MKHQDILRCLFGSLIFLSSYCAALVCPTGFTMNGNICYDFTNTAGVNWDTCNSYCTAKSTTMVCIKSSTENAYIWSMRGSSLTVWVGGYKTTGTNTFNWVAGC